MKKVFISKTDLAQAYFPFIDPRSARNKLMQLINDDQSLVDSLNDCGYKFRNRQFSPKQVDIIVDKLGNPWH